MTKEDVASALQEYGQLLELKGEPSFRTSSYAMAARALLSFEGDFPGLVAAGQVAEIPGIGSTFRAKIETLMATGKPIISTPVRDVVRQWNDIAYIVRNAEEFVATVETWLRNPDPQRIQRGLELAKKCSWEGTVQSMQKLIKEAISSEDRRSAAKTTPPMAESELEYQYQYTPGS